MRMGEALGTDMDMGYLLPAFTAGSSPPILSLCNIQHHISLSLLCWPRELSSPSSASRPLYKLCCPPASVAPRDFFLLRPIQRLSQPSNSKGGSRIRRHHALFFPHSNEFRFDLASSYVSESHISISYMTLLQPSPLSLPPALMLISLVRPDMTI